MRGRLLNSRQYEFLIFLLYDWPLKYGRRTGWKRGKVRKPRPRRRKCRRRRMYRASGNPRRSYIFLQERLSDYAIALRYAITRIYWYIIPRGLGKRRDRCAAYTQIRNRYAVPFVDGVFPTDVPEGTKLIYGKSLTIPLNFY